MNIERLQHLANILEHVPPERFDIRTWSCGTVACAVGHACLDPQFQQQGLHLEIYECAEIPTYLDFEHWAAVNHFFDLSARDSCFLFSMSAYSGETTAQTVADRITAFIANKGQTL